MTHVSIAFLSRCGRAISFGNCCVASVGSGFRLDSRARTAPPGFDAAAAAWQQSPEAVAEWKQTRYPAIRRRAKRENARIYFADESGVRSDDHAGTTWAPRGERPVVEATGARFSINLVSAINPTDSLRFQVVEGTVTAEVFAGFTQRLADDTAADEKVFLIVDGYPTHRAKRVKQTLEAREGAC